jgi:hypothetical protein
VDANILIIPHVYLNGLEILQIKQLQCLLVHNNRERRVNKELGPDRFSDHPNGEWRFGNGCPNPGSVAALLSLVINLAAKWLGTTIGEQNLCFDAVAVAPGFELILPGEAKGTVPPLSILPEGDPCSPFVVGRELDLLALLDTPSVRERMPALV